MSEDGVVPSGQGFVKDRPRQLQGHEYRGIPKPASSPTSRPELSPGCASMAGASFSMTSVDRLTSTPPSAVAKWAQQDSNLRPADYESAALTN